MHSSRPVSALSMRTFACVVAALALGGPTRADCISQTVGTTTIHNCDAKLSTSHVVDVSTYDSRSCIARGRLAIRDGHCFT